MKVAFDEWIPPKILRVFESIAAQKIFSEHHEFIHARDLYQSTGEGDEPWLLAFHEMGGDIILSADAMMLRRPHERVALESCAFTSFILHQKCNHYSIYERLSWLLYWWPAIENAADACKGGEIWNIPPMTIGKAGRTLKEVNEPGRVLENSPGFHPSLPEGGYSGSP